MLERAARRITTATDNGEFPDNARLVQADLLALPLPAHRFSTVVGLGVTHFFDDLTTLVAALGTQVALGGRIYLAGLVAETRPGRLYLKLLHRAGEVTTPVEWNAPIAFMVGSEGIEQVELTTPGHRPAGLVRITW